MEKDTRKWPHLIPTPTGDPPLEPVLFGGPPTKSSNVIDTDPNGSYTGVPTDGSKRPVQDADDL